MSSSSVLSGSQSIAWTAPCRGNRSARRPGARAAGRTGTTRTPRRPPGWPMRPGRRTSSTIVPSGSRRPVCGKTAKKIPIVASPGRSRRAARRRGRTARRAPRRTARGPQSPLCVAAPSRSRELPRVSRSRSRSPRCAFPATTGAAPSRLRRTGRRSTRPTTNGPAHDGTFRWLGPTLRRSPPGCQDG